MDFKEMYKMWIDRNGGLGSSLKESYAALGDASGRSPILTQEADRGYLKPGCLYAFDYKDMTLIDRL